MIDDLIIAFFYGGIIFMVLLMALDGLFGIATGVVQWLSGGDNE